MKKDICDKFGDKFDKVMRKVEKEPTPEVVNEVFTELWSSSDIQSLLTRIGAGYARKMDAEEVESLKMQALWDAIRQFDFSREAKFTTYLYLRFSYSLLTHWTKSSQHKALHGKVHAEQVKDIEEIIDVRNIAKLDAMDFTIGLNEDMYDIVDGYFFKNLNTCEIAAKHGYSRETARRKVKRVLKHMKKMT
jgi:RNA polymerase sigma factor (sigma-70 family)